MGGTSSCAGITVSNVVRPLKNEASIIMFLGFITTVLVIGQKSRNVRWLRRGTANSHNNTDVRK